MTLGSTRSRLSRRLTVAFVFCAVLALVLLHNPTSGYELEAGRGPAFTEPCAIEVRSYLRDSYQKEAERNPTNRLTGTQIEAKVNECTNSYTYAEYKPFTEWRSNAPLVGWLGSIANLLVSVVVAVLMGGAILWALLLPQSPASVTGPVNNEARDA